MKPVMTVALAGLALTAIGLAGCGHNTAKPPAAKLLAPASVAPTAVLVTPTPTPGLDWYMTDEGGRAKLAFGPARSDDARLRFICAKGSGKVDVSRSVAAEQAGSPAILSLGSGTARGKFLAKANPAAEQAGRVDLTVAATTTEPVIAAFQRNGWIAVIAADGKAEGMAPHPGEGAIRKFFDYCG